MVICNLNVEYISGYPCETHTPLFVDADAELARTLFLQRLQTVARWRAEKIQSRRSIQLDELALSHSSDGLLAARTAPLEQSLGVSITKTFNHWSYYISIFDTLQAQCSFG
jgi:hypothetical protein